MAARDVDAIASARGATLDADGADADDVSTDGNVDVVVVDDDGAMAELLSKMIASDMRCSPQLTNSIKISRSSSTTSVCGAS